MIDTSIILYPQSYNKRGDERLHSVQGVTRDGELLNIKLRVDDAMLGKESTPSIAEFSREDVKARNLCLATPDNSPASREGILLFTSCEPDGKNARGIPTYIARWAYVLSAHADLPDPAIGQGRIVITEDSFATRKIATEIATLEAEKPEGWEALIASKERSRDDPSLFSFHGHIYQVENEKTFALNERENLTAFAQEVFDNAKPHGAIGGLLIRLLNPDRGGLSSETIHEVFPKWKGQNQYQTADEYIGWLSRTQLSKAPEGSIVSAIPVHRYACGPSFKNYYLSRRPEESLQKIRKWFQIDDKSYISSVAFTFNKREDTEERFLSKYYPLGGKPVALAELGLIIQPEAIPSGRPGTQANADDIGLFISTGLQDISAIYLPSWAVGEKQDSSPSDGLGMTSSDSVAPYSHREGNAEDHGASTDPDLAQDTSQFAVGGEDQIADDGVSLDLDGISPMSHDQLDDPDAEQDDAIDMELMIVDDSSADDSSTDDSLSEAPLQAKTSQQDDDVSLDFDDMLDSNESAERNDAINAVNQALPIDDQSLFYEMATSDDDSASQDQPEGATEETLSDDLSPDDAALVLDDILTDKVEQEVQEGSDAEFTGEAQPAVGGLAKFLMNKGLLK